MSGRAAAAGAGRRGPSGQAPPPPSWLGAAALPIEPIRRGVALHRVHWSARDPLFFGPEKGDPPKSRFDSATGRFGVLYVGLTRAAAIAETLLRNPERRLVPAAGIAGRSASRLVAVRDLRVVSMRGPGLQALGTDNAISTGPYEPCGLWADALWDHRDAPDGILYLSRHDPSERCLALFERPGTAVAAVAAPIPLPQLEPEIAAILDRYGKGIEPAAWPG